MKIWQQIEDFVDGCDDAVLKIDCATGCGWSGTLRILTKASEHGVPDESVVFYYVGKSPKDVAKRLLKAAKDEFRG